MMEKTYVITIRETPKSVNRKGGGVGAHHMQAHKEKKRWEGLYMMEFLAAKVPKPMQFCQVSVTLFWKHMNKRDEENYRHPVVKPLADALMAGGYLRDDTDEWFQVGEFQFEYPHPQGWPFTDPRIKSYMNVRLEAQYL